MTCQLEVLLLVGLSLWMGKLQPACWSACSHSRSQSLVLLGVLPITGHFLEDYQRAAGVALGEGQNGMGTPLVNGDGSLGRPVVSGTLVWCHSRIVEVDVERQV